MGVVDLGFWPGFCWLFWASDLTIGLAIREAVSTRVEFAVDSLGFIL